MQQFTYYSRKGADNSMVPTWTGKRGKNEKTFSSQGILNRLEKPGNFTKKTNTGKLWNFTRNTGKVRTF